MGSLALDLRRGRPGAGLDSDFLKLIFEPNHLIPLVRFAGEPVFGTMFQPNTFQY
jgi:hypothetical protein